jgi:hypothetical protein
MAEEQALMVTPMVILEVNYPKNLMANCLMMTNYLSYYDAMMDVLVMRMTMVINPMVMMVLMIMMLMMMITSLMMTVLMMTIEQHQLSTSDQQKGGQNERRMVTSNGDEGAKLR